jgi:hypothetical protein
MGGYMAAFGFGTRFGGCDSVVGVATGPITAKDTKDHEGFGFNRLFGLASGCRSR